MNRHQIAVISDTHSLLRPEVKDKITECEAVLHAGDIASQKTFDEISALGTAYFVRGNADKEWAKEIPDSRIIELYGVKIYMIHNLRKIKGKAEGVDIVVSGHTHKYLEKTENGICYLNPGSCGIRGFHQDITMAVLLIEEGDSAQKAGTFSLEKIDFSPIIKRGGPKISEKDTAKLVIKIMKQMDAGKTAEFIAAKNRTEEEFVRQVLQIYTTHPGITAEGILNRLEIWGK